MAELRACVILGGGGHARVLIDSLQAGKDCRIHGVLDADPGLTGRSVLDVPVLGDDQLLSGLAAQGIGWFVVGFGGVADNRPRQRMFELALAHGLKPLSVLHPSAIVSRRATIGEGCQILPGAIVNAGAHLGVNVIVNSGATVEHDCRIGDHVHVATGASLAAAVSVGSRSHVGAGASVRQGIAIGEDAVIGVGAAVVSNVPSGATVSGVPARPLVR